MAKSFRELEVWQVSMELTTEIYKLTGAFPKHEVYGLTSQMRRAAVSFSSNIAEGVGRGTRTDFRRFVMLARGSNCELHTQLLVAARLRYCPDKELRHTEDLVMRVGRMLNGLARYLQIQGETPSPVTVPEHQRPEHRISNRPPTTDHQPPTTNHPVPLNP